MNLIDVLILGFVLFGALHGYQKGLITSIINFISSIVGFLAASWGYMEFLRWVEKYIPLHQLLEPMIYKAILPAVQAQSSSLEQKFLGNILGTLPPEWRSILSSANLPSVNMPQALEEATHSLSGLLTDHILSLIAFGIVFFLVLFAIQILVNIFIGTFFGSWSGTFNRGGGLLFGGLCALIALAILAGLLSPLLKLGIGGGLNTLIQKAFFYPFLIGIFNSLDKIFAAQLSQKLLGPSSLGKGVWF